MNGFVAYCIITMAQNIIYISYTIPMGKLKPICTSVLNALCSCSYSCPFNSPLRLWLSGHVPYPSLKPTPVKICEICPPTVLHMNHCWLLQPRNSSGCCHCCYPSASTAFFYFILFLAVLSLGFRFMNVSVSSSRQSNTVMLLMLAIWSAGISVSAMVFG